MKKILFAVVLMAVSMAAYAAAPDPIKLELEDPVCKNSQSFEWTTDTVTCTSQTNLTLLISTPDNSVSSVKIVLNNYKAIRANSSKDRLELDLTDSDAGKIYVTEGNKTYQMQPTQPGTCQVVVTTEDKGKLNWQIKCDAKLKLTIPYLSKPVYRNFKLSAERECTT